MPKTICNFQIEAVFIEPFWNVVGIFVFFILSLNDFKQLLNDFKTRTETFL